MPGPGQQRLASTSTGLNPPPNPVNPTPESPKSHLRWLKMIVLPPVCDRSAAAALYPEIAESLGAAPLAIDAGRVEKIGQTQTDSQDRPVTPVVMNKVTIERQS